MKLTMINKIKHSVRKIREILFVFLNKIYIFLVIFFPFIAIFAGFWIEGRPGLGMVICGLLAFYDIYCPYPRRNSILKERKS